jgi:hypothetical protein
MPMQSLTSNCSLTLEHTTAPRCWSRSARFSLLPPNDPRCPGWEFEFNRMHAWVRGTNSRVEARTRRTLEQNYLADALRLRHLLLRWQHRAKLGALRRFALERLMSRRALRTWKHCTNTRKRALELFGKAQLWRHNAARSDFISRLWWNMTLLRGVDAIKRYVHPIVIYLARSLDLVLYAA